MYQKVSSRLNVGQPIKDSTLTTKARDSQRQGQFPRPVRDRLARLTYKVMTNRNGFGLADRRTSRRSTNHGWPTAITARSSQRGDQGPAGGRNRKPQDDWLKHSDGIKGHIGSFILGMIIRRARVRPLPSTGRSPGSGSARPPSCTRPGRRSRGRHASDRWSPC